jgi:uncharacterized membrane protein YfcA
MNAAALLGAVLIGLSLGLTGAGGSILTLPLLVYLAGIPPQEAVALSLLVVGSAALAGAWQRARLGEIHAPAVIWFSISGMIGAAVGARFTHGIQAEFLMLSFAGLMLVVAARMLLQGSGNVEPEADCRPLRCFTAGAMVGLLTGFLGVGGGFLLMPALQKFAKLPVRVATGTSLAIIAVNSTAGFFSHAGKTSIHWEIAGLFSSIAVLGVLLGGRFAKRISPRHLRLSLAVLTLGIGLAILVTTLHDLAR